MSGNEAMTGSQMQRERDLLIEELIRGFGVQEDFANWSTRTLQSRLREEHLRLANNRVGQLSVRSEPAELERAALGQSLI